MHHAFAQASSLGRLMLQLSSDFQTLKGQAIKFGEGVEKSKFKWGFIGEMMYSPLF